MASDFAAAGRTPARLTPAGCLPARTDLLSGRFRGYLLVLAWLPVTFYDVFDINVSFIQTCIQIVPRCTPEVASRSIGVPTLLNLVGYVIGAWL